MSTIAAVSTPNAAGGIGMIRISGEDALKIAGKCFRPVSGRSVEELNGYTGALGDVFDEKGSIDEAVAFVYRAPKSYTGENVVELCCHGGLYVVKRALRAVLAAGAEPAGPGEFTKRAFLNGKMELSGAESVMALISASSDTAVTAARNTLSGAVAKKVDEISRTLLSAAASIAAWTDYPEDDVPEVDGKDLESVLSSARDEAERLIERYDAGRAVTEGVKTVICGRPNVGKSTLMNLLSGTNRSIVTEIAGTTRDIVEDTVRVGDFILRLSDTAGIHDTDDKVEKIGVGMALERIDASDLVLAVFDGSVPPTEDDIRLAENVGGRRSIAVINKNDLGLDEGIGKITDLFSHRVIISANNADCLEELTRELGVVLGCSEVDFTGEMLTSERQYACVKKAENLLSEACSVIKSGMTLDAVGVLVDLALKELYAVSGKNVTENVVNEVFSRFCVGK